MHADGDDDGVRRHCADGACLRQRLAFTDVVKRVNAASKRVSQFDTPALFVAGAFDMHLLNQRFHPNWMLAHSTCT
jgi:hypothetical protein